MRFVRIGRGIVTQYELSFKILCYTGWRGAD